jgi:hypothetical protein
MKLKHLIFTGALVALTLFACKKEDPVAEPTCPECWDREMVCVDLQCECPEGSIENWFEAWGPLEDSMPPRKFCIEPNPKTFIAELEPIGCLDTFAFTFPQEPLTEIDSFSNQNGPGASTSFKVERPDRIRPEEVNYTLFYNEEGALELYFFQFPPNAGGEQFRFENCTDFDANGERIGFAVPSFQGVFIHPDTIRGQLIFSGYGTFEYLDSLHVELDLIRTVPYEED